jgi:hypothetical protein
MRNNLKAMAALAVAFGLPVAANAALTVTVDGVGGDSTHYAKLSDAVTYVNANSSEPNVINVTVDSTPLDAGQILVNVPMTINGDADANTTSCDILVDVTTIKGAGTADVGQVGKAFMEVSATGAVTINNLRIHPNANGGTGTAVVDAIVFYKPAAGAGIYTMTNVLVSGSGTGNVYLPVDADTRQYYAAGSLKWYGYGGGHGAINCLDGTGTGTYDVTLNDCQAGVARETSLNIANTSGNVTVNGGIYGQCGGSGIRVEAGTGVTIQGTLSDRVRVPYCNSTGLGYNDVNVIGNSIVPVFKYVDIIDTTISTTNPNGSGLMVNLGTMPNVQFVRVGNPTAYGFPIDVVNGTVAVSDSTFYAKGNGSTVGSQNQPAHIDAGIVSFTDCIFASSNAGAVNIAGGTVDLSHCALPTDGYTTESLATPPVVGTPTTNVSPLGDSPHFVSYIYNPADPANSSYLRPSTVSYNTASSTAGALNGGAGAPPTLVEDWNLF